MKKQLALIATIAVLTACSRKAAPVATLDAGAPAEVAAREASEASVPSPSVYRYDVFGAAFEKDTLSECVDFHFESTEPVDGGDPLAAMTKDWKKENFTRLSKPCREQFPDRTPLATCEMTTAKVDDAGVRRAFRARSERFRYEDVGASDFYMKECLDHKGEWSQLDPKSAEWMLAKHEHTRRKLNRAIKRFDDEP